MKRYLFETIRQFLKNNTKYDENEFLHFLAKKNFPKFFLFTIFAICVLLLSLVLAELNNEYVEIIWAHSIILIFSVTWVAVLNSQKNKLKRRFSWLFLIPVIVYLTYSSYLLGHYSYRAIYFSAYTAVIFIIAVIYTAKWQITALIYLGSGVYIYFFTPYGKTGPSSYTSSNIMTVCIILSTAWFISRVIYIIYKNEFESKIESINARKQIENEKNQKQRLSEEIDHLKVDLEQKINERTDELNNAKIKAEESDRTKALFLANMSHELRTPLSGIIGTLEILSAQDISTEEKETLITMAMESSGELKRIIEELMEISRLRSGHFELSDIPFNPKRLFLQSSNLFKISAKEKGLDFKVQFHNLPKRIISDPNRIKQIVDNLIGNAVKFTNEGSVHSTFRYLSDPSKADSLIITIKDTGIGMDEKTQRRLFDYFYQEDDSLQKKYTGIGLGLTLVKHYVQQFEGVINLDSLKQKGTQFEVIIPVKLHDEIKIESEKSEKKSVILGTVLSVLIVEDNRINRFILKKILQEYHLKILEAENGEKALSVFKENQIDLIFMDIQMPIMDGYEAMREIHKLENGMEIPIIAITGYASAEDKKRIMNMGFDDYLAKPFEKEDIINCILKTQKGEYDEKKSNKHNGQH